MLDQGWSLRTVSGHDVIGASGRILGIQSPYRDDERAVRRRGDGSVALRSGCVQTAVVSRRHHDRNAMNPRVFHRLAKRIQGGNFIDWPAQGKVDDLDVP